MIEILFGIISGIVTGLGMGGGTILILLLSVFLGLEQHIAQATNLVFFIPTALVAIIFNIKQKNIEIKIGTLISICGIIGTILGFYISNKINSNNLRKYFAIFILYIALYEIFRIYKEYRMSKKRA